MIAPIPSAPLWLAEMPFSMQQARREEACFSYGVCYPAGGHLSLSVDKGELIGRLNMVNSRVEKIQ
jgi:hypothetical protein